MRFLLALWFARLASFVSKLSGRGKGSSLPGKLALRICPNVLQKLGQKMQGKIIIVTGTNGKTTTNNMLSKILEDEGKKIVVNRDGANLITGVTTSFIKSANLWGKIGAKMACLEVDEASFPKVLTNISPDIVVITNFFRDQLDRYGELDTTVNLVAKSLKKLKNVTLVLNADDPLVAQLGEKTSQNRIFYGMQKHKGVSKIGSSTREAKFCPFCGEKLEYSYYHYSQLGEYSCLKCGFSRPKLDLEGINPLILKEEISCQTKFKGEKLIGLVLPLNGFYNLYNGLAALATGALLGIDKEQMKNSLASYRPATGRMEKLYYHNKPVILNLVKNPTGFNEGLHSLLELPQEEVVVSITINDNDADGRDISWLWDVDFEILLQKDDKWQVFICSGKRAWEMALRLKYAGINMDKIIVVEEIDEAAKKVLSLVGEVFYFLSTYTALWPMERILQNETKRERDLPENLSSLS